MAFAPSSTFTSLLNRVYVNPDANTTAQTNITGAAATFYGAEVANRANQDRPVFLKLYDSGSATNNTTPTIVLYVPPGTVGRFVFSEGVSFATALSLLVTTTAGTTSAARSPENKVTVRVQAV